MVKQAVVISPLSCRPTVGVKVRRKKRKEKKRGNSASIYMVLSLSGREDSNLRLHAPKACALTGLRYTPLFNSEDADSSMMDSSFFLITSSDITPTN